MLSISECDDTMKLLGSRWIPAFAGMTVGCKPGMHPRPAAGFTIYRDSRPMPESAGRYGALSRDARTLVIGVTCVSTMLLVGKVIPAVIASHRANATQLRLIRGDLAQDRSIIARRNEIAQSLDATTTAFLGMAPAFLKGTASSQGAAMLASVVADAADANGVSLSSLQPVADTSSHTLVVPVSVQTSGTGDIRGISGMLRDLESGVPIVEVQRLMIAQPDPTGPADHMEMLHVELTVRGLYRSVPGAAYERAGQ